jgi:glycosyltransferase involved in cell wall biosynthesis
MMMKSDESRGASQRSASRNLVDSDNREGSLGVRSVLVSHPHAVAFANGVASAFEASSQLGLYVSGIVAASDGFVGRLLNVIARVKPIVRNRIVEAVNPRHVRSLAPIEIAARLTWRQFGFDGSTSSYDALYHLHDAAVARMPWPKETDAVYAYEDAARSTFQRAARRGVPRIWDLPIPHYATLETMWRTQSQRWPGAMGAAPPLEPEWKRQRKDAELSLATIVSVASASTRESLEAVGTKTPIRVIPYGFPADAFYSKVGASNGPFNVIAVGTQDLRKGTPYLLEAWKRAGLKDARLTLVGPLRLSASFLASYAGLFKHIAHVPRAALGDVYRAADIMAFPTLGDGFGLVMQEAMCCGTPVITTRNGGGPECITNGKNGWLIPAANIDALVEALRYCSENRDDVTLVGRAARARAETWTWSDYAKAVATTFA